MDERSLLSPLVSIALLLTLSACGGPNSPSGPEPSPRPTPNPTPTPTPTPTPGCHPGQYLNRDFPDVAITRGEVFSQVSDFFGFHVLRMDIYEPVGDVSLLRPVIVWLFGGHFKTGDRLQLSYYATEFALRGYVTAAIDYRKLRRYEGVSEKQAQDAAQSDAQAAIRFLRSRAVDFSLDTTRLAIAGWSAGSITAFNVAYRPEFVGDNSDHIGFAHSVSAVMGLDGFSTSAGIQPNDPPFVLFRAGVGGGNQDGPSNFATLIAQAKAAGIPYHIDLVEGARHQDLIKHPYDQLIAELAAPFLRAYVGCR